MLLCSEWLPCSILLTILVIVERYGLKLLLLAIHTVELWGLLLGNEGVRCVEGHWLLLLLRLRRLESVSLLALPSSTLIRRLELGIETIVWRPKFKMEWLLDGIIIILRSERIVIPASLVLLARGEAHVTHSRLHSVCTKI